MFKDDNLPELVLMYHPRQSLLLQSPASKNPNGSFHSVQQQVFQFPLVETNKQAKKTFTTRKWAGLAHSMIRLKNNI